MAWKVTAQHAGDVGSEKFESLEEAIADARLRLDEIRDEDRLPPVNMVDEFNPSEEEVHARIQISGPAPLRSKEGGIDLMSDGHAIAYTGEINREAIAAASLDEAFERLQAALAG